MQRGGRAPERDDERILAISKYASRMIDGEASAWESLWGSVGSQFHTQVKKVLDAEADAGGRGEDSSPAPTPEEAVVACNKGKSTQEKSIITEVRWWVCLMIQI